MHYPFYAGQAGKAAHGGGAGRAKTLIENGVKELLIVSQDTGAYGVDTRYRPVEWMGAPGRPASRICVRPWVKWAPGFAYTMCPYPHIDDLIPLMAEGRILPYLDIPFQHASPRILKAMKRPEVENLLMRIKKWREQVPELTIRSTFIVGFPVRQKGF